MIVVAVFVDVDDIFVVVKGTVIFVVDAVFVVVDAVFVVDDDGDDVFLVVDAVYDLVVAPDGTSHVTPTSPRIPPESQITSFCI